MDKIDLELAKKVYSGFQSKVAEARKRFGRSLTLAEKILCGHIAEWPKELPVRGKSNLY